MLNLTFRLGRVNSYIDGKFMQSITGLVNYQSTNAPLEIGHWWS